MELSKKEGRDIVWGDSDDWSEVGGTNHIIDTSRWSELSEAVFLHKPSDVHYLMSWSQGSTEQQDEQPFEYSDPNPREVKLETVTVEKWIEVKEKSTAGGAK